MKGKKGFIVYPCVEVEEGKTRILLYGRLESGESFLTINDFRPYFFILEKDKAKLEKFKKICTVKECGLRSMDSREAVVKVEFDEPKKLVMVRDYIKEKNVKTYEADIRTEYRFMMDKGIKGSVEIKGKSREENGMKVYENPELSGTELKKIPKLKVLALDIETGRKAKEIYCISLCSEDSKRVLIKTNREVEKLKGKKGILVFENEKKLLEGFVEEIKKEDPDIITGWNVVDFDFEVIRKLAEKHKVKLDFGRRGKEISVRVFKDYMRDSSVKVEGRMVLDGIQLLRSSFIRVEDYRLETAAREFLGKGKLFEEEGKGEKIEESYKKNPLELIKYNLNDSVLVLEILKKTGLIELTALRSMTTGMPLERVKASIASFDSLYLRELKERGFVAETNSFSGKEEPITGGFVMESKPGIYDYVLVLDFKSLYPSIIRTFNIDPLMYDEKCKARKKVECVNKVCFDVSEKGILPGIIEEIWKRRDEAKKKKDKIGSYAFKILMNSFFGVLASGNSRYFRKGMANAITKTGQHILKLTREKIKEWGHETIYGDTDSIFVNVQVSCYKEAVKKGREMERKINDFYREHMKKEYKRESFLEIEFEKVFKKFLMPRTRGTMVGAKKRYAGLVEYEERGKIKEKMEFTGLEFVRRDWTLLSKEFQLGLLERIFHGKKVEKFIADFVGKLKKGEMDGLLVYKKALRKELDKYVKTTPPHVKAARKLKELKSNIIEYVITEEGPEPVGFIKHKIDYSHYIEKQLKPIADSVLCFFGKSFDDVVKGSRQAKLGGF